MGERLWDCLQHLVLTSDDLLERVYVACSGLSAATHPTSHVFLSTYHEVKPFSPPCSYNHTVCKASIFVFTINAGNLMLSQIEDKLLRKWPESPSTLHIEKVKCQSHCAHFCFGP